MHHLVVTYVMFTIGFLFCSCCRQLLQNIAAALEGVLPPAVKRESQKIGPLGFLVTHGQHFGGRRLFVSWVGSNLFFFCFVLHVLNMRYSRCPPTKVNMDDETDVFCLSFLGGIEGFIRQPSNPRKIRTCCTLVFHASQRRPKFHVCTYTGCSCRLPFRAFSVHSMPL